MAPAASSHCKLAAALHAAVDGLRSGDAREGIPCLLVGDDRSPPCVWRLDEPVHPQLAAGEPTSGIGILERVNIYATMLWNAVLAFSLLRAHGAAAGEVGQAPKLRSAA